MLKIIHVEKEEQGTVVSPTFRNEASHSRKRFQAELDN